MSPDTLAIEIATTIELFGLITLGPYLSRRLRQITAEAAFDAPYGHPIEDAGRHRRKVLRDWRAPPA